MAYRSETVVLLRLTIGTNLLLYLRLFHNVGAIQDSPCPPRVTGVSPYGSRCTSVCWSETNGTNGDFDPRVTYRSHPPSSRFDVGATEVTYRYDINENTSSECSFVVNVTPACLSGRFDAITRAEEVGSFYAFVGDLVIKLIIGEGMAPGYPKPICAVFPGLPSNLDAALYNHIEGTTYFFKGEKYWTSIGRSVSPSNDRYITNRFYGVLSDLDAALWWQPRSDLLYFFRDGVYWRYEQVNSIVDETTKSIESGWTGVGEPVDAVGSWGIGKTYFFSGEEYWLYDDIGDQASSDGYPRSTTKHWLGCTADDSDRTIVDAENICIPDFCSKDPVPPCPVADFDAITHLDTGNSMGNIFIFRGRMVARLTEASGAIDEGFPRPICSVFPGLPANIDAALTWKDSDQTYFFKGDSVYRFTGYQLDRGFPSAIQNHFPGIPPDIDAALVTGTPDNQQTFFFRDDKFYRFDRAKGTVAPGYPQPIGSYWNGLTVASRVQAALQWINGWSYLFRGEQFFRWDFVRQRVADGYPRQISKVWFGCQPQDERNRCWIRQCT